MNTPVSISEVVTAIRDKRGCSLAEANSLYLAFIRDCVKPVRGTFEKELRDEFAAAALQGMLAHATRYRPRPNAPANWHLAISQEAYEIANAMLEARES